MSLLELVAVVTVMGVLVTVVTPRLGRSIFGDIGAVSIARQMTADMHRAQRSAILTGDVHRFVLVGSQTSATHWRVERVLPSGLTEPLFDDVEIPPECSVSANGGSCDFFFDSTASVPFEISLQGANRQCQIVVHRFSGMILWHELP